MNCEDIKEALLSGHLDQANTPEEEAALQAHLETCPNCRAILETYQEIDRKLAAMAVEPPEALRRGVMARVKRPMKRRRFLFGGGTIAAAAMVALLLAVSGQFSKPSSESGAGGGPVNTVTAASDSGEEEKTARQVRTATATFQPAGEELLVEITDDPAAPVAETVQQLSELPSVMVDGVPEYYVDAAAAREIVGACAAYTVLVPDGLSGAEDGVSCIVRIVAPK